MENTQIKRRGRPPGSKNKKSKVVKSVTGRRGPKPRVQVEQELDAFYTFAQTNSVAKKALIQLLSGSVRTI